MSYYDYRNSFLVLPQQLIDFAWSAPMRELAPKVQMSDVGLRKYLGGFGISPPPQGYWNKVRAAKLVPPRPKSGPRRPGETGRLTVDARFSEVLEPAAPMSSAGPFASVLVPEELDALRAQELKAVGRAASARKLDPVHVGLRKIIACEDRRRVKVANSRWHWDEPQFESAINQRRLRILNALFLTLQRRGHSGSVEERDGELYATAIIGNSHVGLDLPILGRHRTVKLSGYMRPDPALPVSTPLILTVRYWYDRDASESWQDDAEGRLEQKVAIIAAGVIVAGEAAFRRGLRDEEERQKRMRLEEQERRRKEFEALNAKRVENLHLSGELLRRASDIRTLVAELRASLSQASGNVDSGALERWEAWALGEADKLDPIKSGQIRSHLTEPTLS